MTIDELRQKPPGVLDLRSIIIDEQGQKIESCYWLGKLNNGEYFIGFSETGSYCSYTATEECMLEMINNKDLSDIAAAEIYHESPHLSGC